MQMFRLDNFTRNTKQRTVLSATVIVVSLIVGCRGSGRQPIAAAPVTAAPSFLEADTGANSPPPELVQAFRPIVPESLAVPNGDSPKPVTPSVETNLQKKIDDLSGKVVELEKELAEKDRILVEKGEELKLALQPTENPEVPKPLSTAPRKALPALPVIGVAGVVSVIDDNDNVRIRIPDSVLFQPGTMQLTPDGEDAIRNIASEIRTKYPKAALEIEGHTDSLQTDPDNVMQKHDTSSLKSQVVLKYLLLSLQWTDTISSSGHGFSCPVADNDTPEGRAQNNRIEVLVRGS